MIEIPNLNIKVAPFDRHVAKTLATLFFAEAPKTDKIRYFGPQGAEAWNFSL